MQALRIKNTLVGGTKHYCESIINPKSLDLLKKYKSLKFKPRSLILLTTPQNSYNLRDAIAQFRDQTQDLSIFSMCVDTIAPYNQRDGVSSLWLSERVAVDELATHEDQKSTTSSVLEQKKQFNWKLQTNMCKLNIQLLPKVFLNHVMSQNARNTLSVEFASGSTIFNNSKDNKYDSTCFYFLSEKEKQTLKRMDLKVFDDIAKVLENEGKYVSGMSLNLPPITVGSRFVNTKVMNKLEPVDGGKSHTVTVNKGNLIKEIDGLSASSIVQNSEIMARLNKDCKIYAVLSNDDSGDDSFSHTTGPLETLRRYEVVAGGGAWGKKASTLALDPSASEFVKSGSKIKFYVHFFGDNVPGEDKEIFKNGEWFCFEKSEAETNFAMSSGDSPTVIENVFGLGSERSLRLNGINYNFETDSVAVKI